MNKINMKMGSWYNQLQHMGLEKGDFDFSEEAYKGKKYQNFKATFLSQLLNDTIKIELCRICDTYDEEKILLQSTLEESGLTGIISVGLKTIVPLKYQSTNILELKNNSILIIGENENSNDLYTSDGELLVSATKIQPVYQDEVCYVPETETLEIKLKDLTYTLDSVSCLKGFIIRKNISISHPLIQCTKTDKDSELDSIYSYRSAEELKYEDTLAYSIYRDTEKSKKNSVMFEIYISADQLKNKNADNCELLNLLKEEF